MLCNSSWERRVRICERNNSADAKVSEEGWRGGTPGTGVEIPLQPVEFYSAADMYPAAHGGLHATADGYAMKEATAHGELHAQPGSWQEL